MLNNVNKSVVDAVQKILESDTSVKIPTSTGTRVLGHRYGNAAKTHRDIASDPFAGVRGPKEKDIKDIESEKKPVKEDGDCVTKPEATTIAKGEVKKHEKKMHQEGFKAKLLEREMTSAETKKKEKMVMAMKDNAGSFKKKYGSRWKEVMYATATKKAMGESLKIEDLDALDEADKSTDMLKGRVDGVAKTNDFKSFKVKLAGDDIERPQDGQVAKDSTEARKSVEAHGGPVSQPAIKVGEEVEPIDELKKSTLGSYLDKAGAERARLNHSMGYDSGAAKHGGKFDHEKYDNKDAKDTNRFQGMQRAVNKLTKESDEKKPSILDRMKKATAHHAALKASVASKTPSGKIPTTSSTVKEGKDPAMDPGAGGQDQFIQNANPSSNPAPRGKTLARVSDTAAKSMSKLKSEMLGKATGNQ